MDFGQTIGITYYSGYTEVRTSGSDNEWGTDDDLIDTYTFDNSGRVISTYKTNLSKTEIYSATSGSYESEIENAKNSISSSTIHHLTSPNYLLNGNFENAETALKYWMSLGNVIAKNTESSDQCNSTELQFDLSSQKIAYISQYVKLQSGNYTLCIDLLTNDINTTELTLSVSSISDPSLEFVNSLVLFVAYRLVSVS